MSVTELRKLKNSEIKALSEVLAKSDYCFDIIKIKDIKINDIANFVKINLDYFHVLLVNNEIRGFSFAYSLNKAPVKYEFFKDYFSFLKKLPNHHSYYLLNVFCLPKVHYYNILFHLHQVQLLLYNLNW